MKRMTFIFFFFAFSSGISISQIHDTIVKWTFPTGTDADTIADGGISTNLNRIIKTGGGAGIINFSPGFSTFCARSSGWSNGAGVKYWVVMFSTAGYDSLFFTSKQSGSNTGPKHFKVEYKIGLNGTWTEAPNSTITDTTEWTQMLTDSLPKECNEKDSVFLRWIMTNNISIQNGTVSGQGTSRIDDIKVWGHNISGVSPPVVKKTLIANLTDIRIIFSKPVNATAENTTNYTGMGTIASAIRTAKKDTVILTLATPLVNGDAYVLTVDHVEDTNAIAMKEPQNFNLLYNNSIDSIIITEIMYNDPSTTDSIEYIELFNNSSKESAVGGYRCNRSINTPTLLFTLPAGMKIQPHSFVVIAKNANSVNQFFNISGVLQWTAGQNLNNTGDRIKIINTVGNTIDSVQYTTTSPWPSAANGNGPSLVLCDPGLNNAAGANWQASAETADTINNIPVNGTPGSPCTLTDMNKPVTHHILTCYPNPVNETLTITANSSVKELSVYDMIGNMIYISQNPVFPARINTATFRSGIYLVKVVYNDRTVRTQKISKN